MGMSFLSVNDWIANFENKTKQFTETAEKISNDDANKLGKKDPEAYPFQI